MIGISVFFLVAGLFARSWLLISMMIPFTVIVSITIFLRPSSIEMSIERRISEDRVQEGGKISVLLKLRNNGKSLGFLEVYDELPREFSLKKGGNHFSLCLSAGEAVEVDYEVVCAFKGNYLIGPTIVRNIGLFGSLYEEETLPTEKMVTVVPRMEDVRKVRINPKRTRTWLGQIRSKREGIGTEFWGLRDYQSGDDMRKINWKASARTDRLYSNQYEGECSGDAILILDARKESDVGPMLESTVTWGIRAVLSMAAKILKNRNRVGLIVQRDVLDWVYPAFGKKQLYRIMGSLLNVRPTGKWPTEYVTRVLSRFFPPYSQIIMVSPLIDKKSVECVRDMCAHGFDVLVVSPSPIDIEKRELNGGRQVEAAYLMLRMERNNVIRELQRFAEVVDWNTSRPLAAALKEVKKFPHRR